MNRAQFEKRSARNQEILDRLSQRLGPASRHAVKIETGCSYTTLERLLDRGGAPTQSSGPKSHKMSGADLVEWLEENLPERTRADEAEILRSLADELERDPES